MNTVVSLCQFVLLLSLLSLAYAVKAEPKGECLPIGHSDDTTLFHCASMQELTSCQDENDNCMNWAQQGECRKNAAYMIFNCRKSCETCVRYVLVKYERTQSRPHVLYLPVLLPKVRGGKKMTSFFNPMMYPATRLPLALVVKSASWYNPALPLSGRIQRSYAALGRDATIHL